MERNLRKHDLSSIRFLLYFCERKTRGECRMNYSSDMERLQAIVNEFERGSLDMEASLALFEEGVQLIKGCREYIENAKRKVTMLTNDQEMESVLADD